MPRRLLLLALAATALILVGAYMASPYLAVRSFIATARSGDAERLKDAVDFPAVRYSLKPQMTRALAAGIGDAPGKKRGALSTLSKLLAPVIVDRALDALVTPENIAALLRDGGAAVSGNGSDAPRRLDYSTSYSGVNRFRVTLVSPDHPESSGVLTFERRRLFWWTLVRLDLPNDLLTGE